MKITITLYCPDCQSTKIRRNGKKIYGKQNYMCNNCGRQFIGDHALSYHGCCSTLKKTLLKMLVRGTGIRDISYIEGVSINKVLSVLVHSDKMITPKRQHDDRLEVDEFWTYVGSKKNKVWLIYAYHRATGEIVSYVWGKRNCKTAKKLRDKLISMNIRYDVIYTDKWDSFTSVFQLDNHITGKENTKGIEENNCRLRHRIRRAFRKTCCFSKKICNHLKTFDLAFFYINYGFILYSILCKTPPAPLGTSPL